MNCFRMSNEAPPAIEREIAVLFEKWDKEIDDNNYVPLDDFVYEHASPELKAWVDEGRKALADAKARGDMIG